MRNRKLLSPEAAAGAAVWAKAVEIRNTAEILREDVGSGRRRPRMGRRTPVKRAVEVEPLPGDSSPAQFDQPIILTGGGARQSGKRALAYPQRSLGPRTHLVAAAALALLQRGAGAGERVVERLAGRPRRHADAGGHPQ